MLELLYPKSCPGCGGDGWPLCRPCVQRLPVLTPPWCERCGRSTERRVLRCSDCPPAPLDAARAPFVYTGALARAIRALKFSGWRALAPHLAAAMVEVLDAAPPVVTWVPLSRRHRSARGFDQAQVLAVEVARRLRAPALPLLRRVRETGEQARRSGPERRRALRGAFAGAAVVPASVLLVDDVLTTGSTAAGCAEALKARGAERVVALTAARSISTPIPARCRSATIG